MEIPPPTTLPSRSTVIPVRDTFHLFQEVGDVDDREAGGPQSRDHAEEPLGVGRGEAAGGFVQNEDAASAPQSAGDLDDLLFGDGQPPHRDVQGQIGMPQRSRAGRARRGSARDGAALPAR